MFGLKFILQAVGELLHARDNSTGMWLFLLFGGMFCLICYLTARLIDHADTRRLQAQPPRTIDLQADRQSER